MYGTGINSTSCPTVVAINDIRIYIVVCEYYKRVDYGILRLGILFYYIQFRDISIINIQLVL